MIIDGLQINDWSREVIRTVRSGGVNIVHATVGVWEDLGGGDDPDWCPFGTCVARTAT